ncbi:MAG: hypothetical protein HKN37_16345, partial [Rhodothermales bacterium]|nr:hypothetical protein [Rhodothermales bacterium]
MKSILAASFLLVFGAQSSSAQLSGTYTVGGASPDFGSLQEVADSLVSAGVGGNVSILVRPGVYTEAGGTLRVLDLRGDIPGASNAARVRFGPDVASGASSANVILRRASGTREDGFVVQIKSSHTVIDAFTVELADTTAAVAEIPSLVYLEAVANAGVENMIVDGLGARRAWRGILMRDVREDVFARGNRINSCVEPIYIGTGMPADRLTISGNHMTGMSILPENRFPEYGLYLRLDGGGVDVVVADNVLDYRGASGINGIGIIGNIHNIKLRLERNQVLGLDSNYFPFQWGHLLEVSNVTNALIANNFLSGNSSRGDGAFIGMDQYGDTLTFVHNTVRVGGGTCQALFVRRDNRFQSFVRVLDNILISEGNCAGFSNTHAVFSYTTDAEIDYNVHSTLSAVLIRDDAPGANYLDLASWQAAGFGEHSIVQRVEFVDDQSDLHLGECAFEDESLRGIALPLVPIDFDSEGRDPQIPFIGADEPGGGPPDVFGAPSIFAAGKGP